MLQNHCNCCYSLIKRIMSDKKKILAAKLLKLHAAVVTCFTEKPVRT